MTDTVRAVAAAFETQAGWCRSLEAPFTADVLSALAGEIRPGGALSDMVGKWPGDPLADALALRVAGALHALVLEGQAPELAALYPPRRGTGDGAAGRLRSALIGALAEHEAFVRAFLDSPPQTNEVGRSAVLLGGFLRVAARWRMGLRLLEIGASAGLNLLWDRYAYEIGGRRWGDPASPVRLAPAWSGPLPALDAPVAVAERSGCDVAPLDVTQPEARLRLRSYVWPDQPERLARVEGAIALALRTGVAVERADAGAWVAARLEEARTGVATVLYHSIMWQYMPEATQAGLRAAVERAGHDATEAAPFAWLRFEPPMPKGRPELRLTCWPGGDEVQLATAHPHGSSVVWHDVG